MNCTSSGDTTTRLCLVLVAGRPGTRGQMLGHVWDFDSGVLHDPQPLAMSRGGRCGHCGAEGEPMYRVLDNDGRLHAFCDNGDCTLSVNAVVRFRPELDYVEAEGVEYIGFWTCACRRAHVIGGPAGNWTLGYCPDPCGRAVLAQPDMSLAAASAQEVA